MTDGRATASRAALLELRQEREVVQEGHRFLDEKRILLAREILRRLEAYRGERAEVAKAEKRAREALGGAIGSHGLEYLQLHPRPEIETGGLELTESPFLAIPLPGTRLDVTLGGLDGIESDALRETVDAYAELARRAAALAGSEAALLRLLEEYRRTERRVRALENLILPELRRDERTMEDVLEENDLEEAIRVRLFAGRKDLV